MRCSLVLGVMLLMATIGICEEIASNHPDQSSPDVIKPNGAAHSVIKVKSQQEAIKAIEKLEGNVERGGEEVSFGEATTDADLVCLRWFPRLKVLDLMQTQVTDRGLAHLEGLTSMEALLLSWTKVTSEGLSHMHRAKRMQELFLDNTQTNDAGMQHIAAFNSLKILYLCKTPITDAGLKNLVGLSNLESLSISDTKITDAGLANLAGLTRLKKLFLINTQITDAGLKHLRNLNNLECLNVRNTKISDKGVTNFQGFAKLKYLYLSGTRVTASGVKQIRKSLPMLEYVSFGDGMALWGENVPIDVNLPPYYISGKPTVNVGSFSKRLEKADKNTILEVTADMKKQWDRLPFEAMYVTAVRLFDLGYKDEAVYWFYSARLRSRLFSNVVADNKVWSPPWHLCQAFRDFDFRNTSAV